MGVASCSSRCVGPLPGNDNERRAGYRGRYMRCSLTGKKEKRKVAKPQGAEVAKLETQ